MNAEDRENSTDDSVGGCSFGCAIVFVLAGLVWPMLHILGRSYEPESLFIPLFVGAPSFVVAHILGMISISKMRYTGKGAGRRALKFLWIAIGVAVAIMVVAIVIEEVTPLLQDEQENKSRIGEPIPGVF